MDEALAQLRRKYRRPLSRENALKLVLEAVELHMKYLRSSRDATQKAELRNKCDLLIRQAERIKLVDGWHDEGDLLDDLTSSIDASQTIEHGTLPTAARSMYRPDHDIKHLQPSRMEHKTRWQTAPTSNRLISKAEQIILLRGSKLHGNVFPPWSAAPEDVDFELRAGDPMFIDTATYNMSPCQLDLLDDWKRAKDSIPPPTWAEDTQERTDPVMWASKECDFVQDAATDCSVVASLAAATAREEHGHPKVGLQGFRLTLQWLGSIAYPYDVENERPRISANGKYVFRLNFNGCSRRVVIDDRLPVSKTKRVLHLVDRANPLLLWPALLEKAYLKVRGGYDFPGSNSGTDLWILSGWIPEQVFLQHDDTDVEELWPKIVKAFGFGDVMITMGTGKMSSKAERETGLAGEHDYAILKLKEANGKRLLLVKNPWLNATTWRDQRLTVSTEDTSHTSATLRPGTFWMELESVVQNFESIYLNWNPALFNFRQDMHFLWDLSTRGAVGSFRHNPQFTLNSDADGVVWLLLARHFLNQSSTETHPTKDEGFTSIYVFDSGGYRVNLSKGAMRQGLYVDSPQTLLRLDVGRDETFTIVPSEEGLTAVAHSFTLFGFGISALTIAEAPERFPHMTKLDCEWSASTSGGRLNLGTYWTNPQFTLQLKQDSKLCVFIETESPDLSVHIKILYGHGKRLHSATSGDIVAHSYDYRRGCAQVETNLPVGNYILICSAFEAKQTAKFALSVESSALHSLALLPRDGAGKIRTVLPKALFPKENRVIAAPIVVHRNTSVTFIGRHDMGSGGSTSATYSSHYPLKMTIEMGHGPDRRILTCSGDFAGPPEVVRVEDYDLYPGFANGLDVWLVLECLSGFEGLHSNMAITLELFTSVERGIDLGSWRAWDE